MSRLIVKNLPKNTTEEKLRSTFAEKGLITDLQLKYDNAGNFRHFAFVGYKTEEDAEAAREYFDQTRFGSSKITVEFCKELGASMSHRDMLAQKIKEKELRTKSRKVKSEKQKKATKLDPFDEFKNDKEFDEFLKLQRNVGTESKKLWSNDLVVENENDEDETSEKEDADDEKEVEKKTEKPRKKFEFTVKLKGLPYNCKKSKVRAFLKPSKAVSIRLPPKIKGIAYASFDSESELNQSLVKHRGFLDGHRIEVLRYHVDDKNKDQKVNKKSYKVSEPAEEDICDSGRIFIRNLCYSCTEDDIETLFSKYGHLSEVSLPIDNYTKKIKGYGFVSFVFPEHAVKAFTELDGTIFQGRLLHLIPAHGKREQVQPVQKDFKTSYQKEKDQKKKAEAGVSHNWNTLFLGANAVADVISQKYGVTKSKLIADKETKESVAVRMALGETQLVNETKKFLIANGVELDSFKDASTVRSKTVLLVKNLPTETKAEELHELFSKFGLVKRVLLPPFGITAIVEMQEAIEARNAFRKLAYNNFKGCPLYLEWAPSNVLKEKSSLQAVNEKETKSDELENEVNAEQLAADEDGKPEDDTTIFIKNLNFATDEESIRKHFEKCGKVYKVTVARKKHPSGKLLAIGYGFIQFMLKKSATKAMKELQNSILDDHALQLKLSRNSMRTQERIGRKRVIEKKPGTKILIRNIPFEATAKDVKELFSSFGDLKSIRLPKKLSGSGTSHRGFGFAEFASESGAKKAFESLCESTHLYGRRLVLEWANDESESVDQFVSRKRDLESIGKAAKSKKLKKSDLVNVLEEATTEVSD